MMSYVLSILLVTAGFIKQNSKIVAILLFAFLWIMFGWNTDNVDFANYERGYSWAQGSFSLNSEMGYQLIYKLSILLGLTYHQFLIILSFTGLLIIYNTIIRYTKNVAFVLALYFIFPFIIDVVQVRGFLIMSIILYSTRFIIEERKLGTLKFVILVLFATSIHYSALFYISFLLIKQKNISSLTVLSLSLTASGIILAFTNFIPSLALKFVPLEKVTHYFNNRLNWGIIIALVIYAANFLLIYYSYHKIRAEREKQNHENDTPDLDYKFVEAVYKINIILMLLFALYVFNMIFFRLYRNILILNYIAYTICLAYMAPKSKEKFLFGFVISLFIVGLFVYYIILPYYDTVFLPVFQSNSIIGK